MVDDDLVDLVQVGAHQYPQNAAGRRGEAYPNIQAAQSSARYRRCYKGRRSVFPARGHYGKTGANPSASRQAMYSACVPHR